MKKITGVLMLAILVLIISACSGKTENNSKDTGSGEADFPKKPITVLVPYAPGSFPDNSARSLTQLAEKNLPNNQSFKIENVEGGGGIIAMTQLMNAKPDGYTIAYGSVSHVSVLPHMGDATFTHDSFQPIMKDFAPIPLLMVRTDAPYNNFDEWIEYVKANPGKFSYATTGPGSISNLNMVAVAKELELDVKNISYEGGSQGITALLGKNIDGAVVMPSDALEHIEAGTLKPIFEFGQETEYEDAKSLGDLSLPDGVQAFSMLFAPKGIPEAELGILHDAFKKAHESDEYKKYTESINAKQFYLNPEDAQKNVTETYDLVGELLKDLGLID
ncbi:tripartite tricarboxylate transporter substrate binding protein [Sporosarcina sp. GW1-11]|uniref:Bug family tripartite tricarboxylate transporter substrate binding protein n=1 Tax=Sporosarcina sp. GW1-11 TaxID=2899126 RepID=UPI00294F182F|nr:tripartite tricarboxylate transporter substrate binding protein [Sporosarcina sp. GW1-11]MDV6378724.1 tripartite tricarboxylate transporter substrate binding protein [Sporosarcina sp. GW1-11]